MPEMKAALGTEADLTVFRKLSSLSYQTSYSHRGGFYTLKSIPRFDAQGLWCCRGAWFSLHGTLLDTAVALVETAPGGYWAAELEQVLHVPVKDGLRQMVQSERLHRQEFKGHYLYLANERGRGRNNGQFVRPCNPPSILKRRNSVRHERYCSVCWMNSNVGSLPDWKASSSAMAETNVPEGSDGHCGNRQEKDFKNPVRTPSSCSLVSVPGCLQAASKKS